MGVNWVVRRVITTYAGGVHLTPHKEVSTEPDEACTYVGKQQLNNKNDSSFSDHDTLVAAAIHLCGNLYDMVIMCTCNASVVVFVSNKHHVLSHRCHRISIAKITFTLIYGQHI